MKIYKVVLAAAILAVTGSAIAGKGGTAAGGGTGSGGVISSTSAGGAAFGSVLTGLGGVSGLFNTIASMDGARILPDDEVQSPPIRLPNGTVVRFTVARDGSIVSVDPV